MSFDEDDSGVFSEDVVLHHQQTDVSRAMNKQEDAAL